MESIEVYAFVDANGNEVGSYTTQNPTEAKEHAQRYGYRVIAHKFEFADSEPVDGWDFTGNP